MWDHYKMSTTCIKVPRGSGRQNILEELMAKIFQIEGTLKLTDPRCSTKFKQKNMQRKNPHQETKQKKRHIINKVLKMHGEKKTLKEDRKKELQRFKYMDDSRYLVRYKAS